MEAFAKNMVSIMALPINQDLKKNTEDRKRVYQVNFTQALSKSKGALALLLQETKSRVRQLVAELFIIVQKTIEPIRPGSKFPRKHKISA